MAGEKAAKIEICFLSTLGTMTPFFDSFAEKVVWYSLLWCVVSEIIARNIDAIIVIDSAILAPSMKWEKREWQTFQHFLSIVLSSTLSTIQMETFMVYIFVEMFAKYKYAPYSAHDIWKWFYFPIYSLSTWHSYDFCYVARSIAAVVSNSKGSQQERRDEMIVK